MPSKEMVRSFMKKIMDGYPFQIIKLEDAVQGIIGIQQQIITIDSWINEI